MIEMLARDRHIPSAEDEYFIAYAIQRGLEEVGAHVVGPFASITEGLALLGSEPVGAAVLDVNLDDDGVLPIA